MSRRSKKRERTAKVPQRLINKTSIWLAKQVKVSRADYSGYEAVIDLGDNGIITIRSAKEISAKDGRVFDYILSQWQALSSQKKDLDELELDIVQIIETLGFKNRTENRQKIVDTVYNLATLTVEYDWNNSIKVVNFIDKVEVIEGTKTLSVSVSLSYTDAIEYFKVRFINIERAMKLNSNYAIELGKLLQIDGSGVDANGKPKAKQKLEHSRLCQYLHLDIDSDLSKKEIRKAFKVLAAFDYPEYSYNGVRKLWIQQTKTT